MITHDRTRLTGLLALRKAVDALVYRLLTFVLHLEDNCFVQRIVEWKVTGIGESEAMST